jgi:hypothetical protein
MLADVDEALDLFRVIVEVNADNLVMRHHDVINRDLFEIEDAEQHLPVAR